MQYSVLQFFTRTANLALQIRLLTESLKTKYIFLKNSLIIIKRVYLAGKD